MDGSAAVQGERVVAHDFNTMLCVDALKGLLIQYQS